MRWIGILIILISFTGCGFRGTLRKDGKIITWETNRPCTIKQGDFEADGRNQPLLDIKMPDVVGGKIGK